MACRFLGSQHPRRRGTRGGSYLWDAATRKLAATLHEVGRFELTDAEWDLLAPLLPADPPRGGRWKDHRTVISAEQGYRVRYTLATKLVNELVEAADDKQLAKTIARYGRLDWLIIDLCGGRHRSTSLATWNSTGEAPNCASRSSPNGRRRT